MNNGQALISAAMLETLWASRKKDMIDLITPFILYAVAKQTSPGERIDTKAVQKYVQENNAYPDLPESIIKAALARNPRSATEKKEKGFYLIKPLDDEISRMDQRESECCERISLIGEHLSQFLSTHCKKNSTISKENAIGKLTTFFTRYGAEVGTANLASVQIKPEEHEVDYYIARFIFECKDSNYSLYSAILGLVKGYFLRLAIYIQPENGNIQTATFINTSFVLDTPVLIDLLGYRGKERENNAVALINMLKRQKAKLYYFPHIKQEVIDVLTAYKYSLIPGVISENGRTLEGLNSRGFGISDVEREILLLESKLEASYHIVEHEIPLYATKPDNSVDESQVLGESEIKQYIKDNTPHYTEENLNNDIASVLAIHKIRAGQKSQCIETCRCIFVTNNVDFIRAFNKYYREQVEKDTFQLAISVNSLSAITWVKCGEVERLSETELLKNAYCAMQPIPEIMVKLEEVLAKLKESGNMEPEQVVALRASRVFQNDLWINSFGDLNAINELSVKQAQKKYEETLIAEATGKHKEELQEIERRHTEEIKSIQSEMEEQEQKYSQEINDISMQHSEYVKTRHEEDRNKEKQQLENIRIKADIYAKEAKEKWFSRWSTVLNIAVCVLFVLGIGGLVASITLEASLWVRILLGVYILVSAISVYDTVHSKKAFMVKVLTKKSNAYETNVREEKLEEYRELFEKQDSVAEENVEDFVSV